MYITVNYFLFSKLGRTLEEEDGEGSDETSGSTTDLDGTRSRDWQPGDDWETRRGSSGSGVGATGYWSCARRAGGSSCNSGNDGCLRWA